MKISKKEIYLLLALLGIGIAVCAWQFGFKKINEKTEALNVETEALRSDIIKYTAVKDNIDIYKIGIDNATNYIADVLYDFPAFVMEEDMIMLGRSLEKNIDETMVSNVTFGSASNVYSVASKPADATTVPISYSLYNNKIMLSYQTSYEGFKELVGYICENKNRMTIGDFALAYDQTTGLLTATTAVNMYSVTGTDKEYTQQNLSGVGIGTDNIFGTLE